MYHTDMRILEKQILPLQIVPFVILRPIIENDKVQNGHQ